MAPLPVNQTPRYKVNYSVNAHAHSFQMRGSWSPVAFGGIVEGLLTSIADAIYAITISTVEFAADNSDVFLPVTTNVEGMFFGTGLAGNPESNWFYGFQGRTTGGKKWHLNIFGARTLGVDYRLLPGENVDVDAGVADLQGLTDLVGIDALPVTVYPYVNCGNNAYWQRKVRP